MRINPKRLCHDSKHAWTLQGKCDVSRRITSSTLSPLTKWAGTWQNTHIFLWTGMLWHCQKKKKKKSSRLCFKKIANSRLVWNLAEGFSTVFSVPFLRGSLHNSHINMAHEEQRKEDAYCQFQRLGLYKIKKVRLFGKEVKDSDSL